MTNVVNMQEYRSRKNTALGIVSLPPEIKIIKRMAISPYSSTVLLDTDAGVYEWDIIEGAIYKLQ